MEISIFLLAVMGAGFGGYALLVWLGLDDLEAWAGGRVAGLVLIALPAWWAGVVGIVHWRSLGAAALIVAAIVGLGVAWRRRRWRSLLLAEAIFVVFAAMVVFIRLDHPQIVLTEKPMDLGILASLLRAEGFPPPDMWLAGETLPYYYWGALLWTVPLWVAGVPLEFGYNLVVGLIGGVVGCLLWMLGRRSGGGHLSGLLVAFFGLLAGTPDGMRQLLAGKNLAALDHWHSSRQIPDTITEWPLGDVMSQVHDMLAAAAPHARWVDAFCETGAFDAEQCRAVLEAGAAAGLGGRLHGNQLGHGPGVQLAVECGCASVDHCTYLTDADIEALAGSDTVATFLPAADFSTRQPYPDARRVIDAGVTVAIASNCNPGSSFTTSISFCIALAVRDMHMTIDEAVQAATVGGAAALRRSDIGRLGPGSAAHAVILDAPSHHHLAYRPGMFLVRETIGPLATLATPPM